jgi:hypothetical protein
MSLSRLLNSFPLPPSLLEKLTEHGFETADDVISSGVIQLAQGEVLPHGIFC